MDAYRRMGASRIQHGVSLADNQIGICVELSAPGRPVHTIAVEVKDWDTPVGIDVANRFGQMVRRLHNERIVDEGVIISSAGFTRAAREAAQFYDVQLLEPSDLDVMAARAAATPQAQLGEHTMPSPPKPFFAHPYPLQENFVGRIGERQMLSHWLAAKTQPVFALIAIGGMGKSALTWVWLLRDVLGQTIPGLQADPPESAWVCRVAELDRPEGALWWSFYESEATFASFLDAALAYGSGGTVDLTSYASVHDRVRTLIDLLRERRLLIVLDGFERELRGYASLSAVYQGDEVLKDSQGNHRACTDPHAADFLRSVTSLPLRSRILLTSRLYPKELDRLPGCQREDLAGLDPVDAVAFFHAQGVQGTRAELETSCGVCGYHPLTLRLLAGMIVNDPIKPGDVSVASGYCPLDDLIPREHHILALAYDSLEPAHRELLSRLAAFRNPVDYEVAVALCPFEGKRELGLAFRELVNRGLIVFDARRWRYDLHPIVRRYAYRQLVDKQTVHEQLRGYLSNVAEPEAPQIDSVEDLNPVVELYHHTVHAAKYEEALDLYRERLADPLFYQLGAYQLEIDLLTALFDGDQCPASLLESLPGGPELVSLPRLRDKRAQAWVLNTLASSYSRFGQPRRAIPLLEMHAALREGLRDRTNLTIGLRNLASVQIDLGELEAAEANLRRCIAWGQESQEERLIASSHQELGRLLAIRGAFDEADSILDLALALQRQTGRTQSEGRTWAYRALAALLSGDPQAALEAAKSAMRQAARAAAVPQSRYGVRDFVWAYWLLGASFRALGHLREAEVQLSEALTRCRRINLVELEPDVLLAWARWYHDRRDKPKACVYAEEALSIAIRAEYRLKQAEVRNFMAYSKLDEGELEMAHEHARAARDLAECDGPPHTYKPAWDEATRLIQLAGRNYPTEHRMPVGSSMRATASPV